MVQLSNSCRAKDVSVFSGAHRVWQVISQIHTAVPALLIIIRLQQSRLNVYDPETDLPALRRLHIDYAHSISIGMHKEKYFLLRTLDGIDFTYCSATVDRMEPEA